MFRSFNKKAIISLFQINYQPALETSINSKYLIDLTNLMSVIVNLNIRKKIDFKDVERLDSYLGGIN